MTAAAKQAFVPLPECLAKMAPKSSPELDYSTNSNYSAFKVQQTALDFELKFDEKILDGSVTYQLSANSATDKIMLDLTTVVVSKVLVNHQPAAYKIVSENLANNLGKALVIPATIAANDHLEVTIFFKATKDSTALQFLDKSLTDGKKHPYLFSQSEPIHARAIYPCFDTPSVKSPFAVRVKSPYKTLVSCLIDEEKQAAETDPTIYHFVQPVPIPSYLFAIVSGDITSSRIGPRSLVYTEPVGIERCANEFKHEVVEKFLNVLENLVFDYEWKNYDFVIAPMAFPYGGMENPQLTLANSTVVSGDSENIDVIAHELAHSYAGNLVTNASWEHFWLNEGWTVYLERRILAGIHGEPYRHFSAIIGWKDLEESLERMDDKFTKMIQNLKDGSDPDDAFSTVPYEKGFNFLFHLENVVGGYENFDPFIKHYFTTFRKQSLDSYQFIEALRAFYYNYDYELYLKLLEVDYETWLLKTGLPPQPKFDTSMVDVCFSLSKRWYSMILKANEAGEQLSASHLAKVFNDNDVASYSSNQLVVFLDNLLTLHKEHNILDSVNGRTALQFISQYSRIVKNNNAEVKFRVYRLLLVGRESSIYSECADWLGTVGRMKFVRPGYILLNECDRELAVATFRKFEKSYHPICVAMVKKDIDLE
ncbi:bifunctional aminopeptidase/epoxide hydrolase [Saccharomycopsis crataegensis]|uniref:Leucine aminopeptidase 2 n=1 Tax=Saccharomycopsis crataegensis TaxID=43959 RepID=A0AAV5QLA2_9ASCO|nr:bifunctional aminopeptidase/epoxide hydrolase [Saccharomycopsis crataegensis]